MKNHIQENTKLKALKDFDIFICSNHNAAKSYERYGIKNGEVVTFLRGNSWDKSYLKIDGNLNGRNEFRLDCHENRLIDGIKFEIAKN